MSSLPCPGKGDRWEPIRAITAVLVSGGERSLRRVSPCGLKSARSEENKGFCGMAEAVLFQNTTENDSSAAWKANSTTRITSQNPSASVFEPPVDARPNPRF